MARKWVALGLLLVALGGLTLGIVGIATTRFTVKTKHLEYDYDVAEKAYYDTATGEKADEAALLDGWSKASANQNYSDEWKSIPKTANGRHATPIWIGFIAFIVFGAVAFGIMKSIRYY